jgi:hypothetical protein
MRKRASAPPRPAFYARRAACLNTLALLDSYSAATVRCNCSPSPAIPSRIVWPAFR